MEDQRETEVKLRFYRYRPYARLFLLLYIAAIVLFFFFFQTAAAGNRWLVILFTAFLLIPPLWGALRPRSLFSLRRIDDRLLVLTPGAIQLGSRRIPLEQVERLAIYVEAYYGFTYSTRRLRATASEYSSYGDRNALSFRTGGQLTDLEFLLADYRQWRQLYAVLDSWKKAGIPFQLKEAFDPNLVNRLMGQGPSAGGGSGDPVEPPAADQSAKE